MTKILEASGVLMLDGSNMGALTYKDYLDILRFHIQDLKNFDKETFDLIQQYQLDELPAFIAAPELSHILLYRKDQLEDFTALIRKFVLAAIAEKERKITDFKHPYLWTNNGAFFIAAKENEDCYIYEAPLLADEVPVDFLSPFSSLIVNEEMGEQDALQIENYDDDVFDEILEGLAYSLFPLREAFPVALDFFKKYTFTLIPKKHSENYFSSGSNGLYIGRTVLTNAHIIQPELLAEGLIHEAAHAYLYMIEALNPWMPTFEASKELGNEVASCWTGNKISIRSFSQAVFIWYTLFNFWSVCANKGLYDATFVTQRLNFIRNGFEKLDINLLEQTTAVAIPEATKIVLNEVRQRVLSHAFV